MSNIAKQKEKQDMLNVDEVHRLLNQKKKDGSFSLPSTGFDITFRNDAKVLDFQAQAQTKGIITEVLEDDTLGKLHLICRRAKNEG